ncbi:unnamed protein product [Prunus brigantina]
MYFPELWFPDIVLPKDQVLALPLMSAEVPKRSIEEYLMFFRHCTKRSAAQWRVVIRRTYPWFQPGYRLFEKEPEEEAARIDFRKFLSVTLPRDLPHGGGKPPNYHLGAEVYHPKFCARQLGCPQLIPLKSYRSYNRATSWRCIRMPDVQSFSDKKHRWTVCPGWRITSIIAVRDLELPSGDEEDETQAEQRAVEATHSVRRKRKETAPVQESVSGKILIFPNYFLESSSPPTRSKRLRNKTRVESDETGEPAAIPTETFETDDELRKAFEAVEQEKEKEKEEEGEVPSTKEKEKEFEEEQHEMPGVELTSSELALFEDAEAEHSTSVQVPEDQEEQSASEPVEQAEFLVAVPECEVEVAAAVPGLVVEVPRIAGVLAMMTSPSQVSIFMPIHSLLGSSTTASFADPELAEFEAMDLDAQLDKLEKLSSTPIKAKFKAVDRLKI